MTGAADKRGLMVAVGMFDGVHRGHRFLLDCLRRKAAEAGLEPAVVTFAAHPRALLAADGAPASLGSLDNRLALLRRAGIARAIVIPFDDRLRRLTAAEFMDMLRRDHGVRAVLLGFNNRFGSDRLAGLDAYRAAAAPLGIAVDQAPEYAGAPVSSSAVRRMLAAGDVEGAAEALGRPYALEGTVVHGRSVGRSLGFPTANIETDQALPRDGVYAATAVLHDGRRLPAVLNIGRRPTFDDGSARSVEAHIIGFDGELYGQPLALELAARLRDERRFGSTAELAAQLASDVEQAKQLLARDC